MSRRSSRVTRAPARLEVDSHDTALQQAMRKSLLETTRVVVAVPEAPVFRPTAEEFEDPLAYISSIQAAAASSGIAKIVPPPGWKHPEVKLDVKQLFSTKRQQIHALQEGLPFAEGHKYNQQNYRAYAEAFSSAWHQLHPEAMQAADAAAQAQILEDQYWRIVERVGDEQVVVDYANDIDTQTHGTGFGSWAGKWDLSKLVSAPLSALQQLGFSVEGLTHPWLYFGALFATFCWHTEDHFLYSLNYLHAGASKTWYGVPSSSSRRFEDVMRTNAPERFSEDRDLLHQLITLLPPALLSAQGVRVVHTVQAPGEFVVTFPRAHHCGFSHGWNVSEAVNFATLDWLPFGLEAVQRYARGPGKRAAVFSHDKLLWELCEDALEAARIERGGKPKPLQSHAAALPQRSTPQQRPQPQQPSKPVNAVAIANFGLSLAPAAAPATSIVPTQAKPRPLPAPHGRRVASFSPQQLAQLSDALEAATKIELKARADYRREGVRDCSWLGSGAAGGAEGQLAACHECGALPYLSAVSCSCSPTQLRCLAHAHIGCTCAWGHKSLLQRLPDPALLHTRRELKDIAQQGRAVRAILARRAGVQSVPRAVAEETRARPSVKPPVELAAPLKHKPKASALQHAAGGQMLKPSPAEQKARSSSPTANGRPLTKAGVMASGAVKQAQSKLGPAGKAAATAAASASQPAKPPAAGVKRPAADGPVRLSGAEKRARMRLAAREGRNSPGLQGAGSAGSAGPAAAPGAAAHPPHPGAAPAQHAPAAVAPATGAAAAPATPPALVAAGSSGGSRATTTPMAAKAAAGSPFAGGAVLALRHSPARAAPSRQPGSPAAAQSPVVAAVATLTVAAAASGGACTVIQAVEPAAAAGSADLAAPSGSGDSTASGSLPAAADAKQPPSYAVSAGAFLGRHFGSRMKASG